MQEFNLPDIEIEDKRLNDYVSILRKAFENKQNGFAMLCFGIYKCCEWFDTNNNLMSKDKKLYTKYEFLEKFGFSQNSVTRICQCFTRFCTVASEETSDVGCKLRKAFSCYSSSKLFELLPLTDEEIIHGMAGGFIRSDKTVQELRAFVRSVKSPSNLVGKVMSKDEPNEPQEIFDVSTVDICKYYDVEFFQKMDKSTLVTLCLMYQEKYVKNKV